VKQCEEAIGLVTSSNFRLGDEKVDVNETDGEHTKEDEHDQGTDPTSPNTFDRLLLVRKKREKKEGELEDARGEKDNIKFQNQP